MLSALTIRFAGLRIGACRGVSTRIAHPADVGVTETDSGSAERLFAVFSASGTQFKVTSGDVIMMEKLTGVDIGQETVFDDVLMVGSASFTEIGQPRVDGARVVAQVEEQCKLGKIDVFKKNRRKGYRRTQGHRQPVTVLRVLSVDLPTHT